ncbi:SRPBCC family protein [Pseudonocardia benzenivorans]|jgi:carbon monoxide dehydrogenase subunit G|uniref:SRPBCC family protein n=1 Tax=Pseudonocardia benzenivorans TaxID=228005 RepID=A0ABW3VAX4_9PSEU|nr:SRPBCC family protein [Pseudonocardia dioxanivorans]GJF05388.1 hypothetical protein PSD17_43400 [Pseudonocardia sp. D17]
MQLENKFTIAAPIEEAWAALNNPETVAPCFPGATLTEYEDDSFTGTVKVKLGPISLTYKGKGTYIERDDAAHKVVIDATGRDSRGNGTAAAKVTGSMVAQGPDKTEVTMVTDLSITGRPAQFGRGVISDVSEKIIGQFASCLTDKLGGSKADEGAAGGEAAKADAAPSDAAPAAAAPTSAPTAATAGSAAPSAPKAASGPMRSEIDAIDLLDTAGAPVIKRVAPIAGAFAVLLAIFVIVRRLRAK